MIHCFPAIAKEDWSMSRSRSQARLHYSKKESSLARKGKVGFSDEYLDKLDSDGSHSFRENGEGYHDRDVDIPGWERLRLSDGDLLKASRDPEFERMKVRESFDRSEGSVQHGKYFSRDLVEQIRDWAVMKQVTPVGYWAAMGE